jgi:hypothetical protein
MASHLLDALPGHEPAFGRRYSMQRDARAAEGDTEETAPELAVLCRAAAANSSSICSAYSAISRNPKGLAPG